MVALQPGDLIFVRGKSFVDRAIEDISRSPYSHVAGVDRRGDLIEAQGFRPTGFQDLGYYKDNGDVYRCDGLTEVQRIIVLHAATQEIGKQYDYLLIGWELVRYTLHVVLPFREPFHSRICSTLWADAYRSAGVDLCPGIRYPSPGDLATSTRLRYIGPLKEVLTS